MVRARRISQRVIGAAAVVATLLGACGGPPAVSPASRTAPLTPEGTWPNAPGGKSTLASCTHVPLREGTFLSVAGLDPMVRDTLAQRFDNDDLAVLAVTPRGCGNDIVVLGCTRPVAYRQAKEATQIGDAATLVGPQTLDRVPAGERLVTRADGRALLLEEKWTDAEEVSWLDDLTRMQWPMRFGAMRESFAPRIEREDLVGSDCAKATHWVSGWREGAYVVRRARDGGRWDDGALEASRCQDLSTCAEPIGIAIEPLAAPSPPAPGPWVDARELPKLVCPVKRGVALSEAATQAQHLFESGQWRDALPATSKVARGETGDDVANRHRFAWMAAVALDRMGERKRAAAIMNALASQACHPAHDEAAYYMSVLERRAAP